MESLEITTSHNIIVKVELATTLARALATIIDLFFVGFIMIILMFMSRGSEFMWYIALLMSMLYHLLVEYFNNGQSLGKKLLKLRVISLTGERPTLNELVMRWMFRLIDVTVSFGMLASIFISSSKKNQRLGDVLANTTVVKVQNENLISLLAIKNIMDSEYEVSYPQVTRYNDSDMLLIKETLSRYQLNKSDANNSMIQDLVTKITKDLKIKKLDTTTSEFLRTVLNDYIILTR